MGRIERIKIDKNELIQALRELGSCQKVAVRFGVNKSTIQRKIVRHGIDWVNHCKSIKPDSLLNDLMELNSVQRVAVKYNVCRQTIHNKIEEFGINWEKARLKKVKVSRAKARHRIDKDELIPALLELQSAPLVAKKFGVSTDTIYKSIRSNQIEWKQPKVGAAKMKIDISKEELIIALAELKSIPFVAKKFGVHFNTIRKYIKLNQIDWVSTNRGFAILKFNASKEDLIAALLELESAELVAERFKVTTCTIYRYIKIYQIEWKKPRRAVREVKFNVQRDDLITALFELKSVTAVADRFGVHKNTILRYIRLYEIEWKKPKQPVRQDKFNIGTSRGAKLEHPVRRDKFNIGRTSRGAKPKVTINRDELIAALLELKSVKLVAKQLGVHKNTILKYIRTNKIEWEKPKKGLRVKRVNNKQTYWFKEHEDAALKMIDTTVSTTEKNRLYTMVLYPVLKQMATIIWLTFFAKRNIHIAMKGVVDEILTDTYHAVNKFKPDRINEGNEHPAFSYYQAVFKYKFLDYVQERTNKAQATFINLNSEDQEAFDKVDNLIYQREALSREEGIDELKDSVIERLMAVKEELKGSPYVNITESIIEFLRNRDCFSLETLVVHLNAEYTVDTIKVFWKKAFGYYLNPKKILQSINKIDDESSTSTDGWWEDEMSIRQDDMWRTYRISYKDRYAKQKREKAKREL